MNYLGGSFTLLELLSSLDSHREQEGGVPSLCTRSIRGQKYLKLEPNVAKLRVKESRAYSL